MEISYQPGPYIRELCRDLKENPEEFQKIQLQEWEGTREPRVVSTFETTSKTERVKWDLFCLFVPLFGLLRLIHAAAGKILFFGWTLGARSQRDFFIIKPLQGIEETRNHGMYDAENNHFFCSNRENLIFKRIQVRVNGEKVDAFIYGYRKNLENGTWTLVSRGAGDCMEKLDDYRISEVDVLKSNYLFYNYQGIGKTEGLPNKNQVVDTYEALLQFIENKERGIGARQIYSVGRSIGAAVQLKALKKHEFQEGIYYNIVEDRAFSRLSELSWFGKIFQFFGWEFDCVEASEKLGEKDKKEIMLKETILQAAVLPAEAWSRTLEKDMIRDDGLVSPESSLAYSLLSKKTSWEHKTFTAIDHRCGHYGIPSRYNTILI